MSQNNKTETKGINKQLIGTVSIGILAVIGLITAFLMSKNANNSTSSSKEILDSFYKYMGSKESTIIYYGSATCGYCELETPIMEQIKEDYKIDYLYIDASKLTKSENEEILKKLDAEGSTPTIAIVKDNDVEDIQVGYLDGKEMVKFLKENEILDEDAVYTPEQYLTLINYDNYKELISKDDSAIVVIGQTTCSHCIKAKPVLSHIAGKYDIKINYLNLTEMTNDEQTDLISSLKEIGYEDADNLGTPLTLIIKNKKLDSTVEGEQPTSQFVRAFKKAGIITE